MSNEVEYRASVIGYGNVGASIAQKLYLTGILDTIHLRDTIAYNKALNRFYNSSLLKIGLDFKEKLPNVIVIAVPDDKIEIVANQLADELKHRLGGILVFHCSGIHDQKLLNPLKSYGAITAACHPYQTFYRSSEKLLYNIAWGISTESVDYWYFADIISQLEGCPFYLNDKIDKAKYHSSAVFASNFLTSIFQFSRKLLNDLDLPEDVFLQPIMEQTLKNNIDSIKLNSFPLTGPIARVDAETISKHLESMTDNPIYKRAYLYFSLATLELAFSREKIEEDKFYEIFTLLKQKLNET